MTSPTQPVVVRTVANLRACISAWRATGDTVALVPTMGALHQGHLSLVREARRLARRSCVSLFVNPTQFGPNEDFSVYPRDEAGDLAKLQVAGVDLVFAPTTLEMYPIGAVTRVSVPGMGDILEGEFRPGFFTGVATVVCKLLIQAAPDVAVFGEKDYQQLQVVKRMVRDLHLPVRIEGVATVREADGLALSSRNAYLTPDQRSVAPTLYRTLCRVADEVAAGGDTEDVSQSAIRSLITSGFVKVDYVTVRDAETLQPWDDRSRPARVLGAATLGRTRLIDNLPVEGRMAGP